MRSDKTNSVHTLEQDIVKLWEKHGWVVETIAAPKSRARSRMPSLNDLHTWTIKAKVETNIPAIATTAKSEKGSDTKRPKTLIDKLRVAVALLRDMEGADGSVNDDTLIKALAKKAEITEEEASHTRTSEKRERPDCSKTRLRQMNLIHNVEMNGGRRRE